MSPVGGDKTLYQTTLDWIYQKKGKVESAKYGRNKKSVLEAIEEQKEEARVISDYRRDVNRVLNRTQSEDERKHLQGAYDELKEASEKKINCLHTMLGITSLEEQCVTLSHHFDSKAVELAEPSMQGRLSAAADDNLLGFIAPSSQDCVFAAEDNWKWIVKLVNCIDIHLKNAAKYHEFFHEVDESSVWLEEDIARLNKSFEIFPISGEYNGGERLLRELKDIAVSLRQWESRIDRLWHEGNKVVPVQLRTNGVTEPTPARALCNYETRDVAIHEGEDLLLLDNSDTQMWKVRNGRGQEIDIPAVCVLIPGPFKEAIDAAVKMRLKLLTAWTDALKRMGQRLICFMLLVFKPDYKPEEIDVMRSIRLKEKAELMRILDFIEDTLKTHWGDHEGFINLQERILMLRMILDQAGDDSTKDDADENLYKALVVQITMLEDLMKKYKGMWENWDKYKVALEASRSPELMLIVDKWEQLQFVTKNHFSKYWKTELPFEEVEKSIEHLKTLTLDSERMAGEQPIDETEGGMYEEGVESFGEGFEHVTANMFNVRGDGLHRATAEHVTANMSNVRGDGLHRATAEHVTANMSNVRGDGLHRATAVPTATEKNGGSYGEGSYGEGFGYARANTVTSSARGGGLNRATVVSTPADQEDGSYGEGFDETVVKETRVTTVGSAARPSARAERPAVQQRPVQEVQLFEEGVFEEGVVETKTAYETARAGEGAEGGEFGYATMTKTAETEQILTADMEERKTFIIRSVIDPSEEAIEISLNDAILRGIIRPQDGTYYNAEDDESIPIPLAMSQGKIKVQFTSVRRSPEKRSTIGIITVKTIKESIRPYHIKKVKDTSTDEWLSQDDGRRKGILDEKHGFFISKKSGREMMIMTAVERGLVEVEFIGEAKPPEVISQTYAVRAVVDRRLKRTVTFQDALRRGIIDKENGAFRDTSTGEMMYVGDAIMRGFVKARPVDNPLSLNIDPENKMLVDKTEQIRKKVLQPLSVISAFKAAAAKGHSK